MKLNRKFVVRFLCTVGAAAAVAGLLGLGGVFTCSSYPTLKDVPVEVIVQKQAVGNLLPKGTLKTL